MESQRWNPRWNPTYPAAAATLDLLTYYAWGVGGGGAGNSPGTVLFFPPFFRATPEHVDQARGQTGATASATRSPSCMHLGPVPQLAATSDA